MNKSKFLKKSLAALLAILMVVAMIPLSAAAEEAPAPEGPKAPTITVNNATATAPTEEGGAYTATVRDATTVSVSWINAEEGYSAWILTERGVSVAVPFRALDLLTEGKELEKDSDGNVTYQVTFELKKAGATAQDEAVASYPLNIKVLASVPNDDTTIKLVRPNQEFRLNSVQHKFIGIDADVDNENNVITITLPLGMTYIQAGFADAPFGDVRVKGASGVTIGSTGGSAIAGSSVAQINKNNTVVRKVFVPNSVYSTVRYIAPTTATGAGTLTVTSRDGHSRNYAVRFVQESALSNVTVGGASNPVESVDSNGTVTYTFNMGAALTAKPSENFTVGFSAGDNVVRVEDPINTAGTAYGIVRNWIKGASKDSPVRSRQNSIMFFGNATQKTAYLTVKTQANMALNVDNLDVDDTAPAADGAVDTSFYQNIKIVLQAGQSVSTNGTEITELQINGYQSAWNKGQPLESPIKIYVDYDFQFSTGAGQHPARVSGTVNGSHISIPAQDASLVADDYWRVGKQAVAANGRITKPNQPNFDLANVNTEDGQFVLRVWNGTKYQDYTVMIIKPERNKGTAVKGVHLYQPDPTVEGGYRIWDATLSTSKSWQFKLPDNLYNNTVAGGASGTVTGAGPTDLRLANIDGTAATNVMNLSWNISAADVRRVVGECIDEAIAAGNAFGEIPVGSGIPDINVDADGKGVLNNTTLCIVQEKNANGAGTNTLLLQASVKKKSNPAKATRVTVATATVPASPANTDTLEFRTLDESHTLIATAEFEVEGTASTIATVSSTFAAGSTVQGDGTDDTTGGYTLGADTQTALKDAVDAAIANGTVEGTITAVQIEAKASNTGRKLTLQAKLTGATKGSPLTLAEAVVADDPGTTKSVTFGDFGTIAFGVKGTITDLTGLEAAVNAWAGTTAQAISNDAAWTAGTPGATLNVQAAWFAARKFLAGAVTFTPGNNASVRLNSTIAGSFLVIDTEEGAVVTPGGSSANGRAITEQVGVSMWDVGNGFNEGWPATNVYTELEEGVTTLGDWWLNKAAPVTGPFTNNYIYTRNAANNGPGEGINTDTLYFTVRNGNDGPFQTYTITLTGTRNTNIPDATADLIVKDSEGNPTAIATSAIDEDLVYGGNTVTNAILVRNGALCLIPHMDELPLTVHNRFFSTGNPAVDPAPSYSADYPSPGAPNNPGWINPANAAYVNDIGGNNLYNNITIDPVTNEQNASVVTIWVPEDFGTNVPESLVGASNGTNTNAPNSLYFSGLASSQGSIVYRAPAAYNAANIKALTVQDASNILSDINLALTNQHQQVPGNKQFTFSGSYLGVDGVTNVPRTDMQAWANGNFDRYKVSPDNILYVVSEETRGDATYPRIVNTANVENVGAHKYYITVRHQAKQVDDQLNEFDAAPQDGQQNMIYASKDNSLKTITLHVPATYDWTGYRDDNTKDFSLNFDLSEGAVMIDAYRDSTFGFKNNKNQSPSLYADFALTDLTKQELEANKWVSYTDKNGNKNVNPSTFFVKNGELYMINPNTGIETQITGMGDEVNDRYIDSRWTQIMAQEAELRIYNEARNQVNTYKLNLVIDPVNSIAEITSLIVDETAATVDNANRTASVTLPSDANFEAVKLSIAVSPQAKILSVNGKEYDPNKDQDETYDITQGINIEIAAGNGDKVTYRLTDTRFEEPPVPANAEITKLTVDSIEAEVNNTARTATVELPEGSDLSKVKLAIEVSEGDKLVSVAGEEFDAEAEYDLSSPIAIVIEAEDGTKYDYTLTGTVAKPVEPVNPADKYTDLDKIQKEETRDEVKKAINLGLMNGISESKGIFGVGMKMQRFQFALVVARADLREKLLAEDENADVTVNALDAKLVELYPDNYTFTDVSEKIELKAAAAAVQYCYDKGYINGKSLANKIFDPTGNITREEAAKIMVLWAGLEHEDTDVSAIPDGDQISNWAKGYVKAAADAGIMKGRTDGNFDPKGDLQRQDGACLLVRTYENYIVKADEDETPDDGDDDNDNNDGDDDTNNPGGDEDDTSKPDDDTSSTPEDGDDDSSSTPDGEDDNSSSTPDEDNESQPAE